MKKSILLSIALAALTMLGACNDDIEMRYPPKAELPDLPVVEGIHDGVKAPCTGACMSTASNRNMRELATAIWTSPRPSGTKSSIG